MTWCGRSGRNPYAWCDCVECGRKYAATGCCCPLCYDYKHLLVARWAGGWRTQCELDSIGCIVGSAVISEAYLREAGTPCDDCGCQLGLLHGFCYRDRELTTLWKAPAGPALSYDGKTWEPILEAT